MDGAWGLGCATLVVVDDESHLLNCLCVRTGTILVSCDGAADTEQEQDDDDEFGDCECEEEVHWVFLVRVAIRSIAALYLTGIFIFLGFNWYFIKFATISSPCL